MSTSPTIHEVSVSDHAEAVTGLWRRNLASAARSDPMAKLRRGYVDNPAGSGRALLLNDAQSQAVGVICLHARRMHLGPAVVPAHNMADFAVDPAYRTLGPAMMLMKRAVALAASAPGLLYGIPNRNSAAVCKRAGLQVVGQSWRHARMVSSTHPRIQKWPAPLRPLADLALHLVEVWRGWSMSPRLRCEAVAFDDPRIDDLWARRPAGLLLGERTAAVLQWRYGSVGRNDWKLCLALDTSSVAVGWMVWRLREGLAEVGDFFSVQPERLTAPMLNAFCGEARRQGAASVSLEFFGATAVGDALRRAGFRPRGESTPVVAMPATSPSLDLADAGRWYLTGFDNDSD